MKMRECGNDYEIEVVETLENCTGLEGMDAEKKWVAKMSECGLNCTQGGNGFNGLSQSDRKMVYDYYVACGGNRKQTVDRFGITFGTLYDVIHRVEPFEGGKSLTLRDERKFEICQHLVHHKDIEKTLAEYNICRATLDKYFKELDEEGRTPYQYLKNELSEENKEVKSIDEDVYNYFLEIGSVKATMAKFNIPLHSFYYYFNKVEKNGKKPADYKRVNRQKKAF
jgi:transposase